MHSQVTPARQSTLRWVVYCCGVCLEILGMAFTGAVVVVFFGHVDAGLLLRLSHGGNDVVLWWMVLCATGQSRAC